MINPNLQIGIGRSVAILMAREGADISFVYLPEEETDAQDTKDYIEKAGRRANLLALDITVEENCKKAIDSHMEKFGKLNVLVNNSAVGSLQADLQILANTVTDARICWRYQGDWSRCCREDFQNQHSQYFRHDQVRSSSHEAGKLGHQQLFCCWLYGQVC